MIEGLLDTAPCGYLIISEAGQIKAANSTLTGWLGYEVKEIVGKKFELLMGVAGRIFYQTHMFPLLTLDGKAEEIFLSLKTSTRQDLPVLLNAKKVKAAYETEYHFVLMPVHQRKKFEDELLKQRDAAENAIIQNVRLQAATSALEQANIERDAQVVRLSQMNADLANFSKVISHDMQEPVRKIAVFADIVLRESQQTLTTDALHALERITTSSLRMRELTTCLEHYVGVDVNPGPLVACNLNVIFNEAVKRVTAQLPLSNIDIDKDELPTIDGHEHSLELLFYNLILNAVQFTEEGATITKISVRAEIIQYNSFRHMKDKYRYVDFVRIIVTDKGKGFNPEHNDYIFQLFKKSHSDAKGLGFGLSLCKKIVENHYGSISAGSAPSEGAAFTILLPVKRHIANPESQINP